MKLTKYIILFFVSASTLASCIRSYEPEIASDEVSKLVVSGLVTDHGGSQTVTITMASLVYKPEETPVTGCKVTILDDKGHKFPIADSADGIYSGKIDASYFNPGSSFKVEILTPEGDSIVSDFDQITSCPDLDTVYYIRKDLPTGDPDKFVQGIQFYVDLDGENNDSRYYRWEAVETWKYFADYPIEWYYDGFKVRHTFPPDYSKDTCWLTTVVRNVFTLSTENLIVNKYQNVPLHFVDNTTERLLNGYSLLVNQYSLSKAAYAYWNQLRINSTEEGSLYARQPLASKGNLHNLTHPDKVVLGFFGVSSVKSKRIFIQKVEDLEINHYSKCFPTALSIYGFNDVTVIYMPKPIYLMGDSTGWQKVILNPECVDCTASFGKNVKPDFWPN